MTAVRPLRADAKRNRDLLVRTAREVFDAGTFFDLRYDDFAGLAGVGTGTLYRHFPTREALAEAVYHDEIVTLCALARDLRATMPAYRALSEFLRRMVDHMQEYQGLARTLATLMTFDADEAPDRSSELEAAVADLVAAAVKEGDVRGDVSSGAVMMVLHGIGAANGRVDWRTEADDVITLLVDGLRRTASGEATPGVRSSR